MPDFFFNLITAVEHLHSLGLVPRNLRPEVIFQSGDPRRPMFISGHDFTTTISNCNLNYRIPDNIYTIKGKDRRAGSKK